MAAGADLRSRITLEGGQELVALFKQIAAAGEKSFTDVSNASTKTTRSFGTLTSATNTLLHSITSLRTGLTGVTTGFAALTDVGTKVKAAVTGLAAFEGLRKTADVVGDVTQQMQELRNVSKSTQFPTDTLRAFQLGLEQTGNAGEKVGGMFIQFAGAVGDADTAAQGATNAFTQLGINTRSFTGLNRMNNILDVTIKRLAQIKNSKPGVFARNAALLFGEDDITKLGQVIEDVAKVGLPRYIEAMKQFGRFPTKGDFAKLEQYEKALGTFRSTIGSIKMDAVIALFPGLSNAMKSAQATVQSFSGDIKAFFTDLNRVLEGKQAQTGFVKDLVTMKDATLFVLGLIKDGFLALGTALNIVAGTVNKFFGTDWTGRGLVFTLVILKILGAFKLLGLAIDLARIKWLRSPFALAAIGGGAFLAYLAGGSEAVKKLANDLAAQGTSSEQASEGLDKTAQSADKTKKSYTDVIDLTKRLATETNNLGTATGNATKQVEYLNSGMTVTKDTATSVVHDNAWHEMMRSIPNRTFTEVNPKGVDVATRSEFPVGQGAVGAGGQRWVDVQTELGKAVAATNKELEKQATLQAHVGAITEDTTKQYGSQVQQVDELIKAFSDLGTSWKYLNKQNDEFSQTIAKMTDAIDELLKSGAKQLLDYLGEQTTNVLQYLTDLMEEYTKGIEALAERVGNALSKAFQNVGQPSGAPGGNLEGYASGGFVTGPGGTTSDSILARLSHGEFIMRAAAVQHWGPHFMAALNSLRNPLRGYSFGGPVHRAGYIPRFAEGGLVAASADGVTVNLHFPGASFALRGDRGIAMGLTREARRAALLSGGRAPGAAVV